MTSPFLGVLSSTPQPELLSGQSTLIPTEPLPNPRRGLLGKVADVLKSGLLAPLHAAESAGGAVHDFAERQAIGGAPTGYEGILSPEQIKAARPSLGQALFGASPGNLGSDMYRKNLENAAGAKMGVELRQNRQQLFDQIGLPKNGDFSSDPTWIAKALPWAIQHGDIELAKTIAPLYNELLKPGPQSSAKADIFVDPAGNQHFLTPKEATTIPDGWKLLQQGGDASSNFDLFKMPNGTLKYIKKGSDLPAGAVRQQDAMTVWKDSQVGGRADRTFVKSSVADFRRNVKPLTDRAAVIDQALATISDAAHNPDPNVRRSLYSSAVANFVQAADQKAQIRYQLLNYFKDNVDPSIAGKWGLLKARLLDGSLPQYTMYGMIKHLTKLRTMTRREIESQRAEALKGHSDSDAEALDAALPDPGAFFPFSPEEFSGTASPTSATPAKAGAYSPNNPFVKKP